MYGDNENAIRVYKTGLLGVRTHHLTIYLHAIMEFIEEMRINIQYANTERNAADMFMKAISKETQERMLNVLNVQSISVKGVMLGYI
jgi:hypothetical protein